MTPYRTPADLPHVREAAGDVAVARLRSLPADCLERVFQAAVKAYAINRGWIVWETRDSRRSPSGDVDLRMLRVRDRRHVWAELKTDRRDSRLSPSQQWTLLGLRNAGFEAYCWRPSEVAEIVERLR